MLSEGTPPVIQEIFSFEKTSLAFPNSWVERRRKENIPFLILNADRGANTLQKHINCKIHFYNKKRKEKRMWSISPIIRFMSLYCTEIPTLEQVFPLKKINALKDANQSCKSFRTIRGPCQVQHIINFYNNDVAITKTKTKTYFNFAIYALTANFRPCQKIHQHRDWN